MVRVTLFGSRNGGAAFDIARDMPSLPGKVILITGAAGDLGRQVAIEISKQGRPARIYVADLPRDDAAKKAIVDSITHEAFGENESKGGKSVERKTNIRFLELDLTSFESIRTCAAEFMAKEERLDILLLNAGIIRVAPGITKEGHEVHFGLNYLGHALLSKLLLPIMMRTLQQHLDAEVRVVVVSSEGHAMAPKGGIQFEKLKINCADMVRFFTPPPKKNFNI
jgi:retinol dehydrogenase 12